MEKLLMWISLFGFHMALAQNGILSGRLLSPEGQPIQGASVQLKNTGLITITDDSGHFLIDNKSHARVLIFSSIGYDTKEVVIGKDQNLIITLIPSVNSMNSVVVVGYGTQKRKDVTGAVTSVNSKMINEVAVTSPSQALVGRVAGLLADQSGNRPGDDAKILIRGRRSFKASSDPLYVIDGIPIDAGINDINPNDIETIDVLKDASATAVYGSRGANGVILITTKRGRIGKVTVHYDGYFGEELPLRLAPMMNAAQFADYRREAFRNTFDVNGNSLYPSPNPSLTLDKDLFKQDPLVQQNVLKAYDANGNYNPAVLKDTHWGELALRTGRLQNHHISVSGGTEKTRVFFSVGYDQETGVTKGQDYSRYNIKLTLDQELTPSVRMGMSSYYASSIQNYGSDLYGSTRVLNPLAAPYDSLGNLIFQPGNDGLVYNPLYDISGRIDERRKNRYLGSFYTEAKLIPGLRYRFNLGLDYGPYQQGEFQSAFSTTRGGGTAYARLFNDNRSNYNLQNLLYYDNRWKEHSFGITLLQELQSYRYVNSEEKAFGLPYESQLFYNLGTAVNVQGIGSNFSKNQLASFMGRLNYGFGDKYLVTVSMRVDGASVLAEQHKYAYFPSAALAWKISQEHFMQRIKIINAMKLRLGYGRTGNAAIGPYQTLGSLAQTAYNFGNTPANGYRPGLIPNPDLQWETTGQYNAGLDFSLLSNRITGTVDVYHQRTTNLLLDRQLPTASGFNSITQNVGETSNRGVEVSLSTVNVQSRSGFSWTTDFIFYSNKERIESLYNGKVNDVGNKWFIGYPISVYYDYQMAGIWQGNDKDLVLMKQFNANGSNFKVGSIRLTDANNDQKITANDRMILGTPSPKWIGSINSTFSYKGFDLSVMVYAKQKFMIFNNKSLSFSGRYNMWNVDYYRASSPSNDYPRPTASLENADFEGVLYYEDGSFVKIRSINLGYSLPEGILKRMRAQNMRIYVNARNPLMFTKSTALDPENTYGVSTPSVKTFLVGLSVGF